MYKSIIQNVTYVADCVCVCVHDQNTSHKTKVNNTLLSMIGVSSAIYVIAKIRRGNILCVCVCAFVCLC